MGSAELVVIGMALEALKKPEAEARKRATQAKPGQRVGAVPENPTYEKGNHPSPDLAAEIEAGRTDVLVSGALGVSAVDLAVQQRIAAARARIARQRAERATRARRRAYGLVQRHAAKLRHLEARDAKKATTDPQETDHA